MLIRCSESPLSKGLDDIRVLFADLGECLLERDGVVDGRGRPLTLTASVRGTLGLLLALVEGIISGRVGSHASTLA